MSNVGQVRWRLLGEHLDRVYRAAQDRQDETLPEGLPADSDAEILLRLAGAALALLDWHAADGRGRCRVRGCTRHIVRRARIELVCHAIDLALPPARLLAQVGGVADDLIVSGQAAS